MLRSNLESKVAGARYVGKQVILCHYSFYRKLVMLVIHPFVKPDLRALVYSLHFP